MKRTLAMVMSTCLLATSLVGCGSDNAKTEAPKTETPAEKVDVTADSVTLRFNWWAGMIVTQQH